jgi:hypothetical protein
MYGFLTTRASTPPNQTAQQVEQIVRAEAEKFAQALFPLALHSSPLWQPLCYTQIGGLCVATFIILLLVPMLYAIFVFDLILTWEEKPKQPLLARAAEVAAD